MNFIDTIIEHPMDRDQYIDQVFDKKMVFLHHTASSSDPFEVIGYWNDNKEKVGTPFLIAGRPGKSVKWKDGDVFQCFSSAKAAWHLGLTQEHLNKGKPGAKTSTFLNLNTIGIELTCWGPLKLKDGIFRSWAGVTVPEDQVHTYPTPFRDSLYYQTYTAAQIDSLRQLLLYLTKKYGIDPKYKGDDIFEIDKRALRGENGIFTHCSVRPPSDKQDVHPYPPLLQMLRSL